MKVNIRSTPCMQCRETSELVRTGSTHALKVWGLTFLIWCQWPLPPCVQYDLHAMDCAWKLHLSIAIYQNWGDGDQYSLLWQLELRKFVCMGENSDMWLHACDQFFPNIHTHSLPPRLAFSSIFTIRYVSHNYTEPRLRILDWQLYTS
jgi:hypothetical protein